MATLKAIRESQRKLDELAAVVRDSAKPPDGWIKCSDRLPPIRQKVFVYRLGKKTNDGPFFAMTCGNEHRPWRWLDGDRCDITPTHWHEVPTPPTE